MMDGIDVSQYQGLIDWEKVKNRIDFVIIRCGYGQDIESQDDKMFQRNADECTRLNIPFGVYLYSYANNEEEALSEAKHVLRLVKNYKLSLPIYYDLEDPRVGRLSKEQISRNAEVFCNTLRENNYLPGVYANLYWWNNKLNLPIYNQWSRWIAYYGDELNYDGNYDIWQYSQTGFVEGIDSYVDLNYGYKDFLQEIKEEGLNNYEINKESTRYKVGDNVHFDYVFISSDSTMPLIPYMNSGTITRVVEDARNPYLIGDGLGWVNNDVITSKIRYLTNKTYQGNSIVEALKEIGIDSSFDNRKKIAELNDIENYKGNVVENNEMLKLLKAGELKY